MNDFIQGIHEEEFVKKPLPVGFLIIVGRRQNTTMWIKR